MSNLGLGQTAWNRFFRELGLWLAPIKCLRNESRRFNAKRNRTQILEINDVNGFTSAWTLSGVKIGTNTDEDGFLYVRITDESPGANQATIDVYKAAGGGAGNKVATGSGGNSTTITLAAANSSGITGTVAIGVVTASESNDLHRLQIFPDWGLRAPVVWDGTNTADSESNREFLDALPRTEAVLGSAISVLESGMREWLASRWALLMQSVNEDAISHKTDITDGVVSIVYAGLLEDGRVNMRDETTPSAQTVVKNAVTGGSGSFDSQNQGSGTMSAPTLEQWALAGTLRLECTDATIGAEKFSVTFIDAATGLKRKSENELQVKKLFADPIIGIRAALLSRTLTLTSAFTTTDLAAAANHTFTGETSNNTNDGILYFKIVAGTVDIAKFSAEFYTSNSYGSDTLVGKTEEGALGDVVGLNARRNSGLGGTIKLGSGPTVGHTGSINLNTFRTLNTNGVTDKFTVAVTVASKGEFQDHLAQSFSYALNSATIGAETIDDSYVSAGTFPAFEVRDV